MDVDVDVLCLTEEQRQNLDDLLKACRFLLKCRQLKMSESAITYGIDQIDTVVRKIDRVAA